MKHKKSNQWVTVWHHIWKHFHKAVLWGAFGVLFLSFAFLLYEVDNLYSDLSYKADLLESGNVSDPLSVYDQCQELNTATLEVKGGSGYYEWKFGGDGIKGLYGRLTADGKSITSDNETLETESKQVTYIAPPGTDLEKLGEVQAIVTDRYALDAAGSPLTQTFTLHLTPSCVKSLKFTDPAPSDSLKANKGVPFLIKNVVALLYNGMEISYSIPHPRIKMANDPVDSGYFESYRYFYTTRNTGNANLYAVVDKADPATLKDTYAYTDEPLDVEFDEPKCDVSGELVYGVGGSFGDKTQEGQPVPASPRLRTGDNRVIHVKGGMEQYGYTSSDRSVVDIVSLDTVIKADSAPVSQEDSEESSHGAASQDGEEGEGEGTETEEKNTQISQIPYGNIEPASIPVITDYAVILAKGSGIANIFIFDRSGCTALLTVYVDNFPPQIEYAEFRGNKGVVKGATETLYLKILDLDTVDDIIDVDIQLIKGFYSDPASIPASAQKFNIMDYSKDILSKVESSQTTQTENSEDSEDSEETTQTQQVQTGAYARTLEIPVLIPDFAQITDGTYTVLISIMDKRRSASGDLNKVEKTVSLRIGKGINGDIDGDGQVSLPDAVAALKQFTEGNEGERPSLLDIVAILKQITGRDS